MSTRLATAARRACIARAALVPAALVLALATPALAGPPWISIEYPANPLDPTTRGALLLVRTYHHAAAMAYPVTAVAEGLLDGERRTIELSVEPTSQPGVWVVRGELPEGGSWVVSATLSQGDRAVASALVALGPERDLLGIQVPQNVREGYAVPRPATRTEIEALLRTTAAVALAKQKAARTVGQRDGLPAGAMLAGLFALVVLPAGVAVVRERKRSPRTDAASRTD
jgi:hypothetical protein